MAHDKRGTSIEGFVLQPCTEMLAVLHVVSSWVGLRAGLAVLEMKKGTLLLPGLEPLTFQSVA